MSNEYTCSTKQKPYLTKTKQKKHIQYSEQFIVNRNDLKPEQKWLGTATETIFNRNFIAPKTERNEIQLERFETGFLRTENGTK